MRGAIPDTENGSPLARTANAGVERTRTAADEIANAPPPSQLASMCASISVPAASGVLTIVAYLTTTTTPGPTSSMTRPAFDHSREPPSTSSSGTSLTDVEPGR